MDPVWMHLVVNHIPIIATVVGLFVVIAGLALKNATVKRVGLVVYVAAGITVYVANLTGEPAEHQVKKITGISKTLIHDHEEAAELMVTLTSVALFFALFHLFNQPSHSRTQRWILILFLGSAVAAGIQGVITGHLGGLIRRPELGTTQPPATQLPAPPDHSTDQD